MGRGTSICRLNPWTGAVFGRVEIGSRLQELRVFATWRVFRISLAVGCGASSQPRDSRKEGIEPSRLPKRFP